MIYLILTILTLLIYISIYISKNKNENIINFRLLKYYIMHRNKKRICNTHFPSFLCNCNNFENNFVNFKEKCNIKYKQLEYCFLTKLFTPQTKNTTYVENINKQRTLFLKEISFSIEDKINNNINKYRAINHECIIETVAKSYAHAVLLENKFDMFENFKELSLIVKVYKKEAEVLNNLVIAKLIEIYIKLENDIFKIKKDINAGERCKHTSKNSSNAKIYGIYLKNKSASKLFYNNKFDIIKSTSNLISELDEICYKQKIIYNYVKYLYNVK